MIFDIKMSGLIQKAQLVAGGHTTDTPSSITYSSVGSCDSVHIAFLVAALNDLDVMSADIGDRIPSTTPGAEPPRDVRDSGSARSHSMHLETSSSDRP